MKTSASPAKPRRIQRGAASLVVVMLLFFVLSLTAAYTNRNLIFEQKTSANQSRSTAAFEAAEAGIEWALAQLNGGIVDTSCTNTAPTTSFQQRYLTFSAAGVISQTPRAGNSDVPRIWPTCVFNGATWDCTCPINAAADPAAPAGAGPFPAFRVWLSTPEPTTAAVPPANAASSPWVAVSPARPGFAFINSVGCTRLPAAGETCLDFIPRGEIGEGVSFQRTTLALRSGLGVVPAAAVTAGLAVTPAASPAPPLKLVNKDYRSNGLTVSFAEGATFLSSRFVAETIDGTPPELSFSADSRIRDLYTNLAPATVPPAPPALTGGERMFVSIFGMKRATYRNQPGLRVCTSPCSAANVNTLLQNNPDRVIWVDGDLTVNAPIGSVGTPVLMIVDGDTITMDPFMSIFGFVYITGAGSVAPDTSKLMLPDNQTFIQGALVAEGNLVTEYAGTPAASSFLTVTYDAAILDRLRQTYGSWVRLGAAWRDFKVAP